MQSNPLPPWDWRNNWYNHFGHCCLGVLAALLIISSWPVSGCAIMACYLVYQTVEVVRRVVVPILSGILSESEIETILAKGDTPARDVMVFMVGMVPVLAGSYFWSFLNV